MYFSKEKWPRFKKMGRKQFIMRYGLLAWGLPVAILYPPSMAFQEGWRALLSYFIPLLFLFPLGGILFGNLLWRLLERKYASPSAGEKVSK